MDGHSLVPGKVLPLLPNSNSPNKRTDRSLFASTKDTSVPAVLTVEQVKQMVPAEAEGADDELVLKVVNQKNQTAKTKNPMKPATGAVSAPVSGRGEIEGSEEKEHKQTEKEEELARKVGELISEEEAAMLKEQSLLEEKANVKEALERKQGTAEKANSFVSAATFS